MLPVAGSEDHAALAVRRRLYQQIRQNGCVPLLGKGAERLEGQFIGTLHHLLTGGERHLPGLHLGHADEALLPLLSSLFAAGRQARPLRLRLGAVLRGDLCRLLFGICQQTVDLLLGLRIDPGRDFFDSVHCGLPFPRGQPLILIIISMEASRDKMA